ncbi:MAG: serine/threonine-protein kinase [Polyangiales bacterium]|nr:serine/threonine protein kinase [Myxococcales bacterium]MCB9659490.1 serine/threonine protein kinase [Sandaracinaceae bacterium]
MTDPSDLPAGYVVAGRFEVKRKLGEGGMGTVYLATQTQLRRDVALKVILPQHAARHGARTRFEREARVASALRHPNAVEVYDFGEHEGSLYMAMELLEGETLRRSVDLDLPPLPLPRALRYARQVADVLAAAARINLVHRDLKPENIMIEQAADGGERVVVVDFGLAFMADQGDMGRLTREGVVTGTPDYMSPEQARGIEVTPATDVYSLGCVLYEMLTANPPFSGDTAILISRHLFVAPTPIREAFPEVTIPGALDDLIQQMLEKAPEARPTALSVRDALLAVDPGAPERHGSSQGGRLLGRAARMVSKAPVSSHGPTVTDHVVVPGPGATGLLDVAYLGPPADEALTLGLAANGLALRPFDQTPARAVFAPGLSPDELAVLCRAGVPIITDAPKGDLARLSALLRSGAADVVVTPSDPEEVARKLARAIRKSERKK